MQHWLEIRKDQQLPVTHLAASTVLRVLLRIGNWKDTLEYILVKSRLLVKYVGEPLILRTI